ncbi:hypothetical protein [Roseivirga misakiensis]|uniref:Lipoprotein n=1 Tax=Roseivirga misakiensis TaxID=1563681 RepID=A0A1E5T253_9BACT|nr:hypothetical protein [Roseivirga misakiensis]OEK05465.1 hypothetical protein BFP71_18960 [Roseivirga misakiensis]
MKKIYLLIMIVTVTFGCDNKNESRIERRYFENVALTLPEDNPGAYVEWEQGDKTAIVFSYQHEDDKNISDDELTELLYIEIPRDISEFDIDLAANQIESEIAVYFVHSCFCYFEEPFTFIKKEISGKKVSNNQWNVSFDIIAEFDGREYPLKDTGTYVLSSFEN